MNNDALSDQAGQYSLLLSAIAARRSPVGARQRFEVAPASGSNLLMPDFISSWISTSAALMISPSPGDCWRRNAQQSPLAAVSGQPMTGSSGLRPAAMKRMSRKEPGD